MHWRASRPAIFAAVLGVHLLALRFFADFRGPPELADQVPVLPITLFPVELQPRRTTVSHARRRSAHPQTASARERKPMRRRPRQSIAHPVRGPGQPRSIRPWIDWEQEAEAAIDDGAERAAEAAHRAGALSRWREHVLPGPPAPEPQFRWDHAATHRFTPTLNGLVIALNDRCSLLVSPFAIIPGCAIGHIPVHGDLFAHMDDPRQPGDSSVPP